MSEKKGEKPARKKAGEMTSRELARKLFPREVRREVGLAPNALGGTSEGGLG